MSWIESRVAARVRARLVRRNRVGIEPAEASAARILRVAGRYLKGRLCTIVTTGPDGATARVVMPVVPVAPDLTVHIATRPSSTKARQAAASGKAVLVFGRGVLGGVSAYCEAVVLEDPDELAALWRPLFGAFWPDGPAEDYAVIRCRPTAFEVWAPFSGISPAPMGLVSGRIERDGEGWRLAVASEGGTKLAEPAPDGPVRGGVGGRLS